MEHVILLGVNGYARFDPNDDNDNMFLFSRHDYDGLPAPDVDIDGPFCYAVYTIDHSDFTLGRIIGQSFIP